MHTCLRFVCAIIMAAVIQSGFTLNAIDTKNKQPFDDTTLLVKFKPGIPQQAIDNMAATINARSKRFLSPRSLPGAMARWRVFSFTSSVDVHELRANLLKNPLVDVAEYNLPMTLAATPDDPGFTNQWGLHNIGQNGGTADADIDASEAWDVITGSGPVLVAIIDSGVDYSHVDLAANIWVNPGEIAGNGIDDDNNGYVDDVNGYDFGDNDADPMDEHGHGTLIAGTFGAAGNNGIGVTGVNWSTRIMGLKFYDSAGWAYSENAISALLYAVDMGARVVNMSAFGGYSQALYDAVAVADQAQVLVVANRPEVLEQALADRPGRIDQAIEFPLPDSKSRKRLIELYSNEMAFPQHLNDLIVRKTENISGAFIKELMRRIAQYMILDQAGEARETHVNDALEEMLFARGRLNLNTPGIDPA